MTWCEQEIITSPGSAHPEKVEFKCGAEGSGFQAEQLHVEDEGGVRGDDARVSFGAVAVVRGAGQLRPLTHAHLWPRWRETDGGLFAAGAEGKGTGRAMALACYTRAPYLGDSFLPAADHFPLADLEPERSAPVPGRVELGPVCQCAWMRAQGTEQRGGRGGGGLAER